MAKTNVYSIDDVESDVGLTSGKPAVLKGVANSNNVTVQVSTTDTGQDAIVEEVYLIVNYNVDNADARPSLWNQ